MLTAKELSETILKAARGEMSRQELIDMALVWMLRREQVPYEPTMERAIANTIATLMAMDEGPEYELSDCELESIAESLRPSSQ
jgi:hypothetical protein